MEFQQGLMKLVINKQPIKTKNDSQLQNTPQRHQKWRISFYKSSSNTKKHHQQQIQQQQQQEQDIPKEFICPISGKLMADPVITSSGHTFERACAEACKSFNYAPTLPDNNTPPNFETLIPNLALKSAILNFCHKNSVSPPTLIHKTTAENLVKHALTKTPQKTQARVTNEENKLIQSIKDTPQVNLIHAATDVTRPKTHFRSSSNESAVSTPLQLATRPSCCYSSPSSSELEPTHLKNRHLNVSEEEDIVGKLKSTQVFEIEQGVILLRKITRSREDMRALLCTPRLMLALRPFITSRYTVVMVNATAALVNLTLEKSNKVKLVRSGFVPPLIDVLKNGFPEAQEHACGALFSLALEDENKTAIGVLGALQPLMNLLRVESARARNDAALALYHLTLVRSNRVKLVRLGSVPVLLGMVKSGQMTGRVLLVLCNLGSCEEGRLAMLDAGAVECMVGMLRDGGCESEAVRESCVAVLYGLSHGGLRFRALAKTAGMVEELRKVERSTGERAKEKARRLIEMMKAKDAEEEEEEVDWEELIDSGLSLSRTRTRYRNGESCTNSSEF